MGRELYIINHTEQHVVNVVNKSIDENELPYLNSCIGDEIRIVDENNSWINKFMHHIFHLKEKAYDGYSFKNTKTSTDRNQ